MRGDLFGDDIEGIFDKLDDLIMDAVESGELHDGKIELIIAGSAPLIYNSWIPYGTDDIDYVSCSSAWLAQYFPEYNINSQIHAHGDSWTYNYEDRLQLIYQGIRLDVYSMSLEDLLFMKLVRWSSQDIEDIAALFHNGVQIDLDFLRYLIYDEEEARGAGMSDKTYAELQCAYEDFLLRLDTNDWDPEHTPRTEI